jgi:lysophospholipase L1-like esterase
MLVQNLMAITKTRLGSRLTAALALSVVVVGFTGAGELKSVSDSRPGKADNPILLGATHKTGTVLATSPTAVKSPLARLDLSDGDSIVFYGDSITHQRLYTQYLGDYFYTRYPQMRLKLHNAGVSGSVAWEALERFDRDVAAYKPKYVFVLLGMNDGNHEPFNPTIYATYRKDMTTIFEKIEKIGATPIIMDPTMFDARVRRAKRPHANPENTLMYNAVMTYYGAWLREVAMDSGYGFVDVWGPMNNIAMELRKSNPTFTLVPDAVHPGPAGHMVMTTAIIHDMGLSRQVSDICLALDAEKQHQVTATGGKLTDLKRLANGVEFIWQAASLPWVVPNEVQIDAQLHGLDNSMNDETLEIHGLAPGKYTLVIDGQNVGTYDTVQLEHHIELQENAKTPQYQQALAVANLNKQRNEGPVDAMRTEWWNFQDYIDAKHELKEHPDNVKSKQKLVSSEHLIVGMDARIAKDNADARLLEDRIFQINKPVAHKYSLTKGAKAE